MEQATESGMITFDQSLFKLYKEGKISKEEAIKNADSKNNVGLQIRLSEGTGAGADILMWSVFVLPPATARLKFTLF
jgi:twitching motility protein PilU